MKNKFIFWLFIFFLFIFSLFYFEYHFSSSLSVCGDYEELIVRIKGRPYLAQVSNDDCKRSLGLSGRKNLKKDEAMLFIFDDVGNHSFWMKDMKFPIDIVWLDKNNSILAIESEVRPETYPRIFGGNLFSKYVLEIPSGLAKESGLLPGDVIEIIKEN